MTDSYIYWHGRADRPNIWTEEERKWTSSDRDGLFKQKYYLIFTGNYLTILRRMKPKRLLHTVNKLPGWINTAHVQQRLPPAELANFQFSPPLTRMGIKWFNRAALLEFPNVIGPNGSNSDSESFCGLWRSIVTLIHHFTDASVVCTEGNWTSYLSQEDISPLIQEASSVHACRLDWSSPIR